LGAIVAALCSFIIFEQSDSLGSHRWIPPSNETVTASQYTRVVHFVPSEGLKLHAWLFTPENVINPRLIVLGHGFGGQKDFSIHDFAQHFVQQGFAVFTFDYRYWGGSQGEPRHLLKVKELLKDWSNVIDYVFTLPNINTDRIGIWGSSFAGGHVVTTAATHSQRHRIGAVVSQVPFVDGLDSFYALSSSGGVLFSLKLTWVAIKDSIREIFGLPRYYVPLIGKSVDVPVPPVLPGVETWEKYWSIIPGGEGGKPEDRLGGWMNRVPAASAFEIPFYRPTSYASQLQAPTLLLYAEHDSLCPVSGVVAMGKKIPNIEMKGLDIGHFEAYTSHRSKVLVVETEFFKKHLG